MPLPFLSFAYFCFFCYLFACLLLQQQNKNTPRNRALCVRVCCRCFSNWWLALRWPNVVSQQRHGSNWQLDRIHHINHGMQPNPAACRWLRSSMCDDPNRAARRHGCQLWCHLPHGVRAVNYAGTMTDDRRYTWQNSYRPYLQQQQQHPQQMSTQCVSMSIFTKGATTKRDKQNTYTHIRSEQ